MKALIQRVKKAKVSVGKKTIGQISNGLLIFLGIGKEDTESEIEKLIEKIINLRIFNKEPQNHFNNSLLDIDGAVLVISQFTLFANCKKGRRPDFMNAAPPEKALELYEKFISLLRGKGVDTQEGKFGAMMDVDLINNGPVTIMLDTDYL